MKSARLLPMLNAGEIMAHDATRVVGEVVKTIHPADNNADGLEQVLLLPDGTRHSYRLEELRPATESETRRFVLAVLD